MNDYEEYRKTLRSMCKISASYDFDQDPRYGWVHINAMEHEGPFDIVIQTSDGSFGFRFDNGDFLPKCVCHAYEASECCCRTGNWEYD